MCIIMFYKRSIHTGQHVYNKNETKMCIIMFYRRSLHTGQQVYNKNETLKCVLSCSINGPYTRGNRSTTKMKLKCVLSCSIRSIHTVQVYTWSNRSTHKNDETKMCIIMFYKRSIHTGQQVYNKNETIKLVLSCSINGPYTRSNRSTTKMKQ